MTERRKTTGAPHRVLVTVIAVAAAVSAFAVTSGVAPTEAAWVRTRTLNVSATAVTPTAPTGLTCGAASGGIFTVIPFTWTASAGTAPSGYTLKWTGAATGSASFASTSGSVPSAAVALGTITISVYADYGSSWQSVAGTQTRSATSIAFGTLWSCT
jgi:hypothetical protein